MYRMPSRPPPQEQTGRNRGEGISRVRAEPLVCAANEWAGGPLPEVRPASIVCPSLLPPAPAGGGGGARPPHLHLVCRGVEKRPGQRQTWIKGEAVGGALHLVQ